MYKIILTNEAKKDVKGIMYYLFDQLGSKQALLNFKTSFNRCINNLSHFDLGTPSHFDEDIKMVVFSNYMLFYKVNDIDNTMIVLTVAHKSQNIR